MANQYRLKVPEWGNFMRSYQPKAPTLTTNYFIPVLRGETYQNVSRLIGGANRLMNRMGVPEYGPNHDPGLWWGALGSNRNQWTPQIRQVFDNRAQALANVVRALEDQVPGFQGISQRFRYNPSHHALDRVTGGVVVDWSERVGGAHPSPFAHIGDPAFHSPQDLVRVTLHEGRHLQQSMRGGDFNRPSVLAEADAYLFDLEHRNLSGINTQRISNASHYFRTLLDVNDQLATGRPVDPFYTRSVDRGGMGIRETMSGLKRADLELRWNFIQPEINRQLNTYSSNNYYQNLFGGSPYSAWQTGRKADNPLRAIWGRG